MEGRIGEVGLTTQGSVLEQRLSFCSGYTATEKMPSKEA
jgi:hypothetical protein